MRLIDADALLEVLNSKEIINLRHVIDLITNAPTVQREGWVSVPIEPTEEMLKAYNRIDAWLNSSEGTSYKVQASYDKALGEPYYKAMIQAAPTDTE